jgi:hypothetical protein
MLHEMSLFWSIPALALAFILTFVACLPWVPENWAYGVCWVAPFVWAFAWGCITIPLCKRHMARERLEWEAGKIPEKFPQSSLGRTMVSSLAASPLCLYKRGWHHDEYLSHSPARILYHPITA